jgi:hypothetical protein
MSLFFLELEIVSEYMLRSLVWPLGGLSPGLLEIQPVDNFGASRYILRRYKA